MKRGSAHDDDSYRCWKNNSPLLYDVLFNHNMVWPSLCVAWGDEIPVEGSENSSSLSPTSSSSASSTSNSSSSTTSSSSSSDSAASLSTFTYQSLYFSSRTDAVYNFDQHRWKGAPNFLLAATVELPRPRKSNYRGIGRFQEAYRSTHVNVMKRVVHPGEVNKIRLCPHSSDIIATHSDSKYTYVWNMATQPHRGAQGDLVASVPDLVCVLLSRVILIVISIISYPFLRVTHLTLVLFCFFFFSDSLFCPPQLRGSRSNVRVRIVLEQTDTKNCQWWQ